MDYLTIYFILTLAGAATCLWKIYMPAMELVVMVGKHHMVAGSIYGTFIAGMVFFLMCTVLGPLMIFMLSRQRGFVKGFARGMLETKIDD
jgi:ABC-type sulfate transport system permease component